MCRYGYTAGSAPSSLNKNALAYFSSRGPTADGRMKPEITAAGWRIASAAGRANSTTAHCTGDFILLAVALNSSLQFPFQ